MYSKEDIIALEPRYINGIGNINFIYGLDGSLIQDKKRISTIFINMAKNDLIDMEQVRKIIKKYLYIKKNIPYVFNKENIYIGVKTRIPKFKNDGSLTYIKISSIELIEGSKIILCNGSCIVTLENKTSIERKINDGRLSALAVMERKFLLHSF